MPREGIRAGAGNYETYNFYSFFLFIKNSKSFFVNQVPREGIRAGAGPMIPEIELEEVM